MAKRRTRVAKIAVAEESCCGAESCCKYEAMLDRQAALKALDAAATMQELIDAKKLGELTPTEIYEACQRIQALNVVKAK